MELLSFDPRVAPQMGEVDFHRQDNLLFLVTGVGIPQTLEHVLLVAGRERPARILNIGIAGAYLNSGLGIGDVVMADSEIYGDVGFELPQEPDFQPVSEADFGQAYRAPFTMTQFPEYVGARVCRGCTVNTCTGTDSTGSRREQLFHAHFETMEGAAVAQAGQALGIPVCEVRAISNIAAVRDMQPGNIKRALTQLTTYFHQCREAHHV
jgi:futalosine hydrolase